MSIPEREPIIEINRNASAVVRYLGGQGLTDGDPLYDTLGKGSSASVANVISVTASSQRCRCRRRYGSWPGVWRA